MNKTSGGEQLRDSLVVVGVLTYQRPERLGRMLPQVLDQVCEVSEWAGAQCSVLVVDNDPAASARDLIARIREDWPGLIRYVHEATPGITAARRRVMYEALDADFLQFIDDDEEPGSNWLRLMLQTWLDHDQPAAVAGSIRPRYLAEPPAWVREGGFFDRAQYPTGTEVHAHPTSNLLLDLNQVRELGLEFDARLGMRGGEDTLFTRQLTRAGRRIVFCREAPVYDLVPSERSNREWVLRRAKFHGATKAHLDLLESQPGLSRLSCRAKLALGGVARCFYGIAMAGYGKLVRDQGREARGLRKLYRARGIIAEALWGVDPEYAR